MMHMLAGINTTFIPETWNDRHFHRHRSLKTTGRTAVTEKTYFCFHIPHLLHAGQRLLHAVQRLLDPLQRLGKTCS